MYTGHILLYYVKCYAANRPATVPVTGPDVVELY